MWDQKLPKNTNYLAGYMTIVGIEISSILQ